MKIPATIALALLMMFSSVSVLPASPQRDVPGEVNSAREALRNARNELEHAGGEWGGHRVAAMKHIDEAMKELGEAERWAREHHDIK
ncbi:MAG TPA: hypothetical protein VJQ54_14600 [Candidatus Sulfotelmatobacter sp.]|nr:hypothetical protein [Candidatus Sulfotelmatobacter sp.]